MFFYVQILLLSLFLVSHRAIILESRTIYDHVSNSYLYILVRIPRPYVLGEVNIGRPPLGERRGKRNDESGIRTHAPKDQMMLGNTSFALKQC